jgi:hypothetical protein
MKTNYDDSIFLQSVGKFIPDYTALHPTGEKLSKLGQWEIQNMHNNVIAFVTTA